MSKYFYINFIISPACFLSFPSATGHKLKTTRYLPIYQTDSTEYDAWVAPPDYHPKRHGLCAVPCPKVKATIVFTNVSLFGQWEDEIKKYAPHLKVRRFHNSGDTKGSNWKTR